MLNGYLAEEVVVSDEVAMLLLHPNLDRDPAIPSKVNKFIFKILETRDDSRLRSWRNDWVSR
jgi:hypothetical protein